MKKKIYVVKRGRKTGIFDDWKKKCEPQIERFPGALFCGFAYMTEYEADDETKEGSLRHAFLLAEKYMGETRIGGFRLVYQGRNKDYMEEDSWKKEGFLPFGEEMPDDAGNPQEEGDYDDTDDYDGGYDDTDDYDYDYDDMDEDDSAEESSDGFVLIDDDFDGELPFAYDVPSDDAESESQKKQEASSEESAVRHYDLTKEEEVYGRLHIPKRPNQNEPWLEILLYIAGDWDSYIARNYVGRYHVPTLYTALLAFVFDPKLILRSFVEIYKAQIGPNIKDRSLVRISPASWVDDACRVWEDSDEYRVLKQRFEAYDMEYLDFDELLQRCRAAAKESYERILNTNPVTYRLMKSYIRQGGHSLSDLYRELTENDVYRKELMKVSGPYVNPDLERKLHREETKTSFKQLVMHAESIGVKLKEQVIGQDDAIDKLESAFFHAEKSARQEDRRKGPRSVFLFVGPSGVGKTFMAQLFADELGLPFRRFDMSGYCGDSSVEELAGISTFWKQAKPGVLTDYVNENPHSVLLFDEIEKAHSTVIRLFLQILDDGICFDRYYDTNISLEDTIIIFTTNAGRQRYGDAKDENLTALPDRLVLDALEKDINPKTKNPFFPPEILSRMSSHTVIMFNHLRADALRRVVEKDVENQLVKTEQKFGYNLRTGKSKLAKTVLYSMGGSADARNASRLAGKLIDRQLLEFMYLMMQKMLPDNIERLKKIEWDCDFTGATDEVRALYSGEKNSVIPVLGVMKYEPSGSLKENGIAVKDTTDSDAFMGMLRSGNVLFAVIDYTLGLDLAESSLNIADERTVGSKVFLNTIGVNKEIPIYILCGGKSGYQYSDREKHDLIKRGARGFIDGEFYEEELEAVYWDVCCQGVMDRLARRHQILTYKTRKGFTDKCRDAGRIEFYDLRLETAVESEDLSSILSDVERPDVRFCDVIGAEKAKEELQYFVEYLTKPKEFVRNGVRPPRGILLYGPPGTGKTMLARAMAGESDVAFLQTSATEFKNKYIGESEANIRRIFEKARKYAPAIIFIDEIDAIGKKRTGSENTHDTESMLNALLTEMDGFRGADSNKPVFVLAATNYGVRGEGDERASLDDALLRRFDNKIYVALPKESEREQYILRLLAGRNITTVSREAVHSIAERTTGKSLADLQNVFELAFRNVVRQSGTMADDDLLTALEEQNHGEKREHTPDYYRRVAIHETGHAYVSYISGDKPSYITIESRGDFGGYMQHANQEDVTDYTREELLAAIRTSLAGRAAEQVFYGRERSLNTGASSDLQRATNVAFRIVCAYGMEEDQLIALSKDEVFQSALVGAYTAKVNEILKTEMKNAVEIIENAKAKIQRIADVLVRENRLTGKQFEELMEADG